MLKGILVFVFVLSAVIAGRAAQLSFHEDCTSITKSSSNVYHFRTETCPDISRFNACAYHNGMKFSSFTDEMDMNMRVESILNFYTKTVDACTKDCREGALGACVILGRSIPPFNSMDNGHQQYIRLGFLQKACLGGAVEACAEAGYETGKIWSALSSTDGTCPEPKFFTLDESCYSPDTLLGYMKSNALDVGSPADFYAQGCALQHGTSCRMLMNFHLEHSDPDFDPAKVVAHVCEFGGKLDCNGAKVIEKKFKSNE